MNKDKIIENIAWLLTDKVIKTALSFIIFALVAKHLGVEQFGVLIYVTTIVGFILSLSSIGLNGIVANELTLNEDHSSILSTSAIMCFFSSLLVYASLAIYIISIDLDIGMFLLIYGLVSFFKFSDIARYYLEYSMNMKKMVIIDLAAFIFICSLKILAVYSNLSLVYFVTLASLESIISSIALIFLLLKTNLINLNKFSIKECKHLFKRGAPLILSSMSFLLLAKIDTLMIKSFLGFDEVGVYSAASKLSEFWFFVPAIIAQAFSRSIYEMKKENKHGEFIEKILGYSLIGALLIGISTVFISNELILMVFGVEFELASNVLIVHVWSSYFVFISYISGRWLIAENLEYTAMYRTLIGVVINIAMNMLLIPKYGIVGAAFGTLLGFGVGNYFSNIFFKSTRPLFMIQTRAILFVLKPSAYLKEISNVVRTLYCKWRHCKI